MSETLDAGQALLLGIVQGLTEFLPVSSSGHLALAEAFLGIEGGGVALAVLVHAGTLLAILIVYQDGVARMLRGALGLVPLLARPPSTWPDDVQLAGKVAVAAVPGALVGLFLADRIESVFASPAVVGALLLVTAAILAATRSRAPEAGDVTWTRALLIGAAQAFAILPGISRSGTTIAVALFLGVARSRAAEFSFLAAIPLLVGSAGLEVPALLAGSAADGGLPLALAFVSSFLVGWACLLLLVRLLREGRLHWFAAYCAVIGVIAIVASAPL